MSMLVIDGLTVKVTINNGLTMRAEDLSDRARSISGNLLVTQLSATAQDEKWTVSCTTKPMTTAERDTLVAKLKSAALLPITGDVGSLTCSATITGISPIKAGGIIRWIANFELVED